MRNGDQMNRVLSNRIFAVMVMLYGLLAALSIMLPQSVSGVPMTASTLPASLPVLAAANAALVLVAYGGLGIIGLLLARRIGLPEIWDAAVSNRSRLAIPAILGVALGMVLIAGDRVFAPFNGIGTFSHPPFPLSIIATTAAAIGEEIMFRLFFISFWTWLIGQILLRGRGMSWVYGAISVLSAIVFGLGHLPALMFLYGWTTVSQMPGMLLVEILLLNGLIGLIAAVMLKRAGFLGAVGVHFWTDVVWHVVWGAL
jgi:hypothetical protein